MWQIIGLAALGYLFNKVFIEDDSGKKKRVFISFAVEDKKFRDFLIAQSKNPKSNFDFVDMSVYKAWKNKEWKLKCRNKIKSCDGIIVLLSKNIWKAGGARWEMKCASEEDIPVIGIHIYKNNKGAIPPELDGNVYEWTWGNLEESINSF
jgi:antiphage defense system Thoeris ThsB-like protein